MRGSDKVKIRHRRIAHGFLILISFSLMFVGKADISAFNKLGWKQRVSGSGHRRGVSAYPRCPDYG